MTKIGPTGGLIYSSYLGGSAYEYGSSIATDGNGNAYVTGWTNSTDFTRKNAFQKTCAGGITPYPFDGFITKVGPGGALIYSSYLGGSGNEYDMGLLSLTVVADAKGNAYLAGCTTSTDFPVKKAFCPTFGGLQDIFVTKIGPLGGIIYSTYLGGSDTEDGYRIAIDAMGNAYVTGKTFSTDFPLKNAFQKAYKGAIYDGDAFVAKFGPGGGLIYSTYLGGMQDEYGSSMAVDAQGNAYVTGYTTSANFPVKYAFQKTKADGYSFDAFVAKFGPKGMLIYSSYLGGITEDRGQSIGVDSSGNVYVVGLTNSSDFPMVNAFQQTMGGGYYDAFAAKITPVMPGFTAASAP